MSAIEQSEDQWHVQIEAGDVRLWTLDQLDAAFKAELVDESTFVLEVGKTEWMQLGTLLGGGGDDEEESAAAPAPDAVANVPNAVIAQAIAQAQEAHEPRPAVAPVLLSEPPPSMGPYSTAPMASDIDDFEPSASFGRSRKKPIAIGIGVALLAAGVAVFGMTRASASTETSSEPVAAAAPAPPPVAPVADPPAQAPQAAAPTTLSARLTQDQLDKLASADKVRAAKLSAQQKSRAAAAPQHSGHHSKEKGPFHSGGDKYDPLNAKL